MLVNPLPHTYLMHCPQMHHDVCMHETNREGRKKLSQGGGSGGGLIVSQNATQFRNSESCRTHQ